MVGGIFFKGYRASVGTVQLEGFRFRLKLYVIVRANVLSTS